MRVAVVVSTWTGHPPDYLRALCASFERHEAGADYALVLCANGEDYRLPSGLESAFERIFVRENVGFNMGAWDFAWRRLDDYDRFLFAQDDCYVRQRRWLRDFIACFERTPRCGLVGENLRRPWNKPWDVLLRENGERSSSEPRADGGAARARYYRKLIEDWGIPPGENARHLTAVVQFTSREALEAVDGYNIAATYQEAIAAEIAFSRKIEARGLQLAQVGRYRHSRIGHRQWRQKDPISRWRRSMAKRIRRLTGRP